MSGMLGDALAYATIAHHGQMYGDQPYISHPIAVARLLLPLGLRGEVAVAALLHDVVEDTPTGLAQIRSLFGGTVAWIVDGVTRRPGENYMDFVLRAAAEEDSRIVKLADNTHNLSGLRPGDPRERRYLRARKELVTANGGVDPWAGTVSDSFVSDDMLGTPRHHRARKAGAISQGNTEKAATADRDLRAAVLAKHIREVVDKAPPLTDAQRLALSNLLVGGPK